MNLFQQQPQFGFDNSNLGGLLPSTLDSVNPAFYDTIRQFVEKHAPDGRLASITGVRLYDFYRVDAGVMPQQGFVYFANAVSAQQGLVVAGTQYKKNNMDVSFWIDGGKLAQGYEALIWSMQVVIVLPTSKDESVFTSGNNINLTNDPGIISGESATDAVKAGNLMRAALESSYFEFFMNNSTFEHGTGLLFPTLYGPGNMVSLVGTVAAPASDGMLSNTCGWAYNMPILRHIPSLTRFGVRAQFQNPFDTTNTVPFRMGVILEGIGVSPATA